MQPNDFRGLVLTNTLTKRRELFSPRNKGEVKIFTCGPSVYRRPHLGNYRTFIYEDILVRYLEYLGYRVERVINFTDIEDKTIATAAKEGIEVGRLTGNVEEILFREVEQLGISLPGTIPRSSTSIDAAVSIIEKLLESGHAYRHGGNIYFDPLKYDGFGEIFGLDMRRWPEKKVRFSKDTYNGLRWNLGDFILWHGWDGEEWIHWDTALGKGRPAWNVQDPAMIASTIGYELDIHCGGIDNMWRHHDYNRAILESVSGKELSHYWLHGEHLIVEGQKMSKSKGNVLYVENLIERDCDGQRIRFLLSYGYYRDKMNITDEMMEERCRRISALQEAALALVGGEEGEGPDSPRAATVAAELEPLFEQAMNDDFQIRKAVDSVFNAVHELNDIDRKGGLPKKVREAAGASLKRIDSVLGVIFPR
jgi:cysteinyl-tRNA synthetase